jgi:hypothetical protein
VLNRVDEARKRKVLGSNALSVACIIRDPLETFFSPRPLVVLVPVTLLPQVLPLETLFDSIGVRAGADSVGADANVNLETPRRLAGRPTRGRN